MTSPTPEPPVEGALAAASTVLADVAESCLDEHNYDGSHRDYLRSTLDELPALIAAARSGHDGLREALRVMAIEAATIHEAVKRLADPWDQRRDGVRDTLRMLDHTATSIESRVARALSPEADA